MPPPLHAGAVADPCHILVLPLDEFIGTMRLNGIFHFPTGSVTTLVV
jgi:hypothetical protein